MRIAIFDDVSEDAEYLESIITDWGADRNYPGIRTDVFNSVRNLDYELENRRQYDIFFMDIMTPEDRSAGFRAAEKIRMKDLRAAIVFTTNSREYIESAFEIAASQYLIKPLVKDKIYRVLDHLAESRDQSAADYRDFSGIDKKLRLPCKDILYLESDTRRHRAVIHMADGREHTISLSNTSFKDLVADVLPGEFIQCHRSYIINLRYVTGYSHESVYLSRSVELPLGERFYRDLLKVLVKIH